MKFLLPLMQMLCAGYAAAIACACWTGTGLTLSSGQPFQIKCIIYLHLTSQVLVSDTGGELYHHFCLQLGSELVEHHLSISSNFQFRKVWWFCFLGFFLLLVVCGGFCVCVCVFIFPLSFLIFVAQSRAAAAVFAWHTNLSTTNVSLCTPSKPKPRQYFSLNCIGSASGFCVLISLISWKSPCEGQLS